jgi:hypothetical protein
VGSAAKFEAMIADFEAALADLPPLPAGSTTVALPEPHQTKLAPIYNRLLHRHGGEPIHAGAVNPDLDRTQIEQSYVNNAPGYAWLDGLLTPEALRRCATTACNRRSGSAAGEAISAPSSRTASAARCCCRLPTSCARPCPASSPGTRCGGSGRSSMTAG